MTATTEARRGLRLCLAGALGKTRRSARRGVAVFGDYGASMCERSRGCDTARVQCSTRVLTVAVVIQSTQSLSAGKNGVIGNEGLGGESADRPARLRGRVGARLKLGEYKGGGTSPRTTATQRWMGGTLPWSAHMCLCVFRVRVR